MLLRGMPAGGGFWAGHLRDPRRTPDLTETGVSSPVPTTILAWWVPSQATASADRIAITCVFTAGLGTGGLGESAAAGTGQ
ncbi:hypothetical protein GCM10027575_39180 [Phytohabitans suffuscus]